MRITRLRLVDIRRHRDLELRPASGLTVVRGPNESGKSTIQQALELVLFRRATTAAAEIAEIRSWAATGDPQVELDFEHEGTVGRLVKRFAGSRGSVRLETGGTVETDPGRVDHILAAATGLPSEKFFRSTASVRHFEIEELDRDERALRDRLQASIGGGDLGTSNAKKRLDDAARRLRAAGAKNPGPIRSAADKVAGLADQLHSGEAALARLTADRATLAAASAARRALEEESRQATADLEAAETAVRLDAERRSLQDRYEHFRRATDLAERLAAAEAAPGNAIPIATLRPAIERLRNLSFLVSQLTDPSIGAPIDRHLGSDAAEVASSSPLPTPTGRRSPWSIATVAWAVVAVLALLAGLLAIGIAAGVVLAGVAGALAFGSWLVGRRRIADAAAVQEAEEAAEAAQARTEHGERVARQERARADTEARLLAARAESAAILGELGVADVGAAEMLLAAADAQAADVEQLRAELRGLLGEPQPLAELRAARDDAAARAAQGSHALDGLGAMGADPESARLRAQGNLRAVGHRLSVAIGEQGEAAGRVSGNTVDAEGVAAIAESLAVRTDELAVLERRARIYEQTLAAIIGAEAATMQKAARFLERHMATDVARITDGRYGRVRVDENDLAITVWSPERGAWVDARSLSKGTADQLYLAARLGLVRQVTQDRKPPLVFDDPFVTFDDARAIRAIELLRELAADHQVLYLTCSDRYDAVADLVITLQGPAARDATPAPMPQDRQGAAA